MIFELAEGAVRHLAHAAPDPITAGGTQHLEKDIQTVLVDPAEDELDHALAEGIQGPVEHQDGLALLASWAATLDESDKDETAHPADR